MTLIKKSPFPADRGVARHAVRRRVHAAEGGGRTGADLQLHGGHGARHTETHHRCKVIVLCPGYFSLNKTLLYPDPYLTPLLETQREQTFASFLLFLMYLPFMTTQGKV